MLRTILVIIHASAGLGGLVAGAWLLPPPASPAHRRWVRRAYWLCLLALLGSVVVLIVVDWPELAGAARVAFLALVGLAVAMLVRLGLAERSLHARPAGWQARYLGHVYFTYISLWVGVVIVPALRTPLPQLFTPLAVVAVLVTGHLLLARYRSRMLAGV
jgi:uncharacterized membrane protein YhaH (DUF805 family)